MTYFKYTKKEFAFEPLDKMSFQIGTLFEYRKTEKYGVVVGDESEGTKIRHNDPNERYDFSQPAGAPDFIREFIDIPNGKNIRVEDCSFQKITHSANLYLYCIASSLSRRSLDAFKSDAVLEISDVHGFAKALTACIPKEKLRDPEEIICGCVYQKRDGHYSESNGPPPALLKDPDYSYQSEARIIWFPQAEKISPFTIRCEAAASFCSLVDDERLKNLR